MTRFIFTLLFLCGSFYAANAQVAVKTNLIGWSTTSINAGLEVKTAPQNTLSLFGSINPFAYSDHKQLKHWLLQPEYKYWFCEPFYQSYLGVHAIVGEFDAASIDMPFGLFSELKDNRFQGWMVGGGVSFGYQWLLSRHWNVEASVGVGYLYIDYDKYPCAECGTLLDSGHKHYVGPTKLALSIVYLF